MAETDATGGRGELEMPPQALAALQQGRKIEAIRLVRAAHGSELRQAKGFVERFIAADPALQAALRARTVQLTPGQLLRLAAAIALAVILVLWWRDS